MLIFPAIDLYEGQAVRLFKGDYSQKTVYSENPVEVAAAFKSAGAGQMHIVDLEGARDGSTPNYELICRIKNEVGLFVELGGGIRSMEVAEKYLNAGIDRIILGTAAITDEGFLREAVSTFGRKIAVGIDIKDGFVAIKGWKETTTTDVFSFFEKVSGIGVSTTICTDISRDGAMQGTNCELYAELSKRFPVNIIASGGVSSVADVKRLRAMNIYGAIIGKAYYTGAIDLKEAIGIAK